MFSSKMAKAALSLLLLSGCPSAPFQAAPFQAEDFTVNGLPYEEFVSVMAGETVTFATEVKGGVEPLSIEAFGPGREKGKIQETLLASADGATITFKPRLSGTHRVVIQDALGRQCEWQIEVEAWTY